MQTHFKFIKPPAVGLAIALPVFLCFSFIALGQSVTTSTVIRNANLRAGPGTNYAISGQATQGQTVTIVGKDAVGDWYQLATQQWIAAFLVRVGTSASIPATTDPPPVQPVSQSTPVASTNASATANRNANLRAGPGTTYPVSGGVSAGQALVISGQNADGSWLQLANGAWIAAFLVSHSSATTTVAPPLATPAAPTATGVVPPPAATSGNNFVVVQKHLWDVYENGGSLFGPSVSCGLARELIVNVLDEHGNRLNGVAVQVQYGAREIYVTGSQGKGDGMSEFVLGSGQDVKVVRDVTGQDVTSDVATGLSTNPVAIPYEDLISAQYCQDADTCKKFGDSHSCLGHFSWTITFKRQR